MGVRRRYSRIDIRGEQDEDNRHFVRWPPILPSGPTDNGPVVGHAIDGVHGSGLMNGADTARVRCVSGVTLEVEVAE